MAPPATGASGVAAAAAAQQAAAAVAASKMDLPPGYGEWGWCGISVGSFGGSVSSRWC